VRACARQPHPTTSPKRRSRIGHFMVATARWRCLIRRAGLLVPALAGGRLAVQLGHSLRRCWCRRTVTASCRPRFLSHFRQSATGPSVAPEPPRPSVPASGSHGRRSDRARMGRAP
jgi:hypothetical protein